MWLAWSRYSALLFAIGLAIGEAVINWGNWQFAPMWLVDYVIVLWLIFAFLKTRRGQGVHWLTSGWAFTAGIFYMAFFGNLDPELPPGLGASDELVALIGFMLGVAVVGFVSSLLRMPANPSP